jgi:hypothetical protein
VVSSTDDEAAERALALLDRLRAGDLDDRTTELVYDVARDGTPWALPVLLLALEARCEEIEDDDEYGLPTRMEAARGLGRLRDPRAVAPLALTLLDPHADDEVAQVAAWALGAIGDPEAIDPLATAANRLDPGNRWELAMYALARFDEPRADRAIERADERRHPAPERMPAPGEMRRRRIWATDDDEHVAEAPASAPAPVRLAVDASGAAPDRSWASAATLEEACGYMGRRIVSDIALSIDGAADGLAMPFLHWMSEQGAWPIGSISFTGGDRLARVAAARIIEAAGLFVRELGATFTYRRPSEAAKLYAETDFYVTLSDGRELKCRAGESPHYLSQWGPFAVITASNPVGAAPDATADAGAHARLVEHVERLGGDHRPATGRARHGLHSEQGLAIWGLSAEEARALGRRFGQRAIFLCEPAAVTLRDCAPVREEDERIVLDFRVLCATPAAALDAARAWRRVRRDNGDPGRHIAELDQAAVHADVGWLVALATRPLQPLEALP